MPTYHIPLHYSATRNDEPEVHPEIMSVSAGSAGQAIDKAQAYLDDNPELFDGFYIYETDMPFDTASPE